MLGGNIGVAMRYGALDAMVARQKAGMGVHHHFPGERRMRTQWSQQADGTWVSDGVDEYLWEVLCHECGDTDGPKENQPRAAQELRGPYKHEHHAKVVAEKHFDAN